MNGGYTIARLCEVLEVSSSGYYAWRQRQRCPGKRARENVQLSEQIGRLHQQHERVYGSPRITQALRREGLCCGRHRVARLMRAQGLVGRAKRRFRVQTTDSAHGLPIAPNRLLHQAKPSQPNRTWVCDITYVQTQTGWLYLAAVMDLYSRCIVGWAMHHTLQAQLPIAALQMAIARRRPAAGLIVHSDRGIQYASAQFRAVLAAHGLVASMSRKANCYDNAAMEAFWSSLKLERLYRHRYPDHRSARRHIFTYIEGFYNRHRLHSTLGYQSPLDFEAAQN